ncbi:class I SAM-dependent methyltransferase [Roseomonas sp. KE2513]|nr:class I SAM-dependent methyltransferase [Roseomonas sp. KE2513]
MAVAHEALPAAVLHGGLADLLPVAPAPVLDVGAGSGRDAAWLADLGHDVVAVEPAAGLRRIAEGQHPSPRIRWLDNRLPALATTARLGLSFDAVLLSAVWMHLAPADRPRALPRRV